jgi:glycosyltransferase involved in cell wall biosynthesis
MQTPILMDITRSISRNGQGHETGIDRVEHAYINHFASTKREVWFLAKIGHQLALLPPSFCSVLRDLIDETPVLPRPGILDALRFKISRRQRKLRSLIRRHSVAVCNVQNLAGHLGPRSFDYFNVGHSNLSSPVLSALKTGGCNISVLIHDMIPLDFPEFTRPKMQVSFDKRMRAVSAFADNLICNSEYTNDRASEYFAEWGRIPRQIVAPLGLENKFLKYKNTAAASDPPYFVILGTIEGRKNHQIIFDVWNKSANPPLLYVVGRRGWNADAAISFLENSVLMGTHIHELSNFGDAEMINLLQGARALLFPSFVEGFGLPAIEAAALGTSVIASDIPALREVLQENAIFVDPKDSNAWGDAIKWAVCNSEPKKDLGWVAPTWKDHFKLVTELTLRTNDA